MIISKIMYCEPIELKKALNDMPPDFRFTPDMAKQCVKILKNWWHSNEWKDRKLAQVIRNGNSNRDSS